MYLLRKLLKYLKSLNAFTNTAPDTPPTDTWLRLKLLRVTVIFVNRKMFFTYTKNTCDESNYSSWQQL